MLITSKIYVSGQVICEVCQIYVTHINMVLIELKHFTKKTQADMKIVSCYLKVSICSIIQMNGDFDVRYAGDTVLHQAFSVFA